jgi:ElaB/YqjD/DUF883 family membrane-anchored ribosome-binding protein
MQITYAPETGSSSSSGMTDVSTELTALRADITGLAESVTRLAAEAPELAKEGIEASIRRNPLQATLIAAGVGFVLSLIIGR